MLEMIRFLYQEGSRERERAYLRRAAKEERARRRGQLSKRIIRASADSSSKIPVRFMEAKKGGEDGDETSARCTHLGRRGSCEHELSSGIRLDLIRHENGDVELLFEARKEEEEFQRSARERGVERGWKNEEEATRTNLGELRCKREERRARVSSTATTSEAT